VELAPAGAFRVGADHPPDHAVRRQHVVMRRTPEVSAAITRVASGRLIDLANVRRASAAPTILMQSTPRGLRLAIPAAYTDTCSRTALRPCCVVAIVVGERMISKPRSFNMSAKSTKDPKNKKMNTWTMMEAQIKKWDAEVDKLRAKGST
jgi:hypothetical protein